MGKDPADLVKDKGGKEFMKFVDKADDFISFYADKLIESNDSETFEGRHAIIKELLPLLKRLSASSKDYYVRELSTKLNMKEQFLYDELESFSLPVDHPARDKSGDINKSESFSLEQVIFGIILDNPKRETAPRNPPIPTNRNSINLSSQLLQSIQQYI